MDSKEYFVIELAIDDWATFLESADIKRYSTSVSIDGLEWNFYVDREETETDGLIDLTMRIGFTQPDPSCSYASRAAMFVTTNPSDLFGSKNTTKQEIIVYGRFSHGLGLWARRERVINDAVVVKVHISPIEKFFLRQPSSYTIRAPGGRTNVVGIENAVKYPTLFMPYIDDRLETVIELWSCNPFMARSFKSDEFYVPPKIGNPDGIANIYFFYDYLSKQESQLGSNCNELVILNSHYPRDGGLAWINFIQIRIDLHRVTNRWLKFSQPPASAHKGLAFTKVGWVIWHCDKTGRCDDFRLRIWILEETQVENAHDKVISLKMGSGEPVILFTFDRIYALGIADVAVCALKDGCFHWVTYSLDPFLCKGNFVRLLQWREDSLVLVDGHWENSEDLHEKGRIFINEIKKVRLNGKEWYNVIPRFAIQNVPNGWYKWPMMMTNSLLVFSGPNDTITVSFLQPLSLNVSALLVVEKQMAHYIGTNWNGDRISLGGLTKEKLEILFREVRKWRYLNNC